MKAKLIFILPLLAFLCLISCMGDQKKNSESTSNHEDFIEISVDKNYKISIPRDMKKTTGLNSDASLQYQNIQKEIYTIVIDEPNKAFIDVLKELGHEEKSSIAFYRDVQLKRLAERMDVTRQSNPTSMTISGLEAEAIEMDAKVDNIEEELTYFLTFIEGESNIYTIMSWTLKSKKQRFKNTFLTIVKSFKVSD